MALTVISDVERLARIRVRLAFMIIYLLGLVFLALGERLYAGSPYLIYSRLATIPFFLLLFIRWMRLVRPRPPALLAEARRLVALGRARAAHEKLAQLLNALDTPEARRLNRARRILQDGLAVTVEGEVLTEMGRCSLALGELDRAVEELGRATARIPARADIALELAEALSRRSQEERATEVLAAALPFMDAVDQQTLLESHALRALLRGRALPERSRFAGKIQRERLVLVGTIALLLTLGAYLVLGWLGQGP